MKLPLTTWLLVSLAFAAGSALGAGGLYLYGGLLQKSSPSAGDTPGERLARLPSFGKVRSPRTSNAVSALGRLTPRGEVIAIGGLMGDRLGSLKVQEGQWVEEKAVLGYLESYEERKAERDVFEAQLTEARERRVAETAYADALVKEAEVGVRQAKELDPLDIEAQEAKVRLLGTERNTAQTDLDRLESLKTPGAVPKQKLDQQAQLVRRCQEELVAAQKTLAKMQAGRVLNRDRAQAQLEAARAGRKRVDATVPTDSLIRNLALAEVRLERTVLRAPRAACVLKIFARPGERVDNKPILKLGDTRGMYAVAEVYETDAGLVRPGQQATVTSPALSKALTGTVERVGRMIYKNDVLHVDPAADADARVVEAWILLETSEAASHLINLQVDVVIDVSGGSASSESQ
ncbi:MAG TPA: efflux RND transporter periplasmic adaptor subunit [Gemmataceae bacterium]|jgi:HlyD family secretion protein